MDEVIPGSQPLVYGSMGLGACQSTHQLNIQPIVTNMVDIERAVKTFIDGNIEKHP